MAQTKSAAPDPKVRRKEEASYFKEAASWDEDRVVSLRKSRRTGWWVASAEFVLILLLTIAILMMLPLKTTDVRLVRVDSSTGIVDQVVKLADAKETYDEAMTKFFLRRVVILRETYTRAQLQNNYDQSVLFTAPSARAQLKSDFSFDNPNGPYKRYGELGTAAVQIVTVSFVAKNVAQVRYVRTDHKGGADTQSRWVATIEFRYVSQPASEDARGVNPLGFQVTNYRNDPEAVLEAARP
jgi:type IV secretion system protein VirB8